MDRHFERILLVLESLLLLAAVGHAQSTILDLPRPSQHAVLTQRVGITDITINYHRPLVNGQSSGETWSRTGRFGAPAPTKTPRFRSPMP